PDELQKALDLIRVGKITVNDASKHYHILIVTLYSRLSGLRGSGKPGAKTILSNEEEKFLIYVIQKYQEWQYPLSRSDFISIARTFMIQLNKPNISDYSSLHCWFDHLHKVLFDLNLLDRPEAIYNVDELAFGDDPGRKQVIIKRNSKFATCIQGGSGKSYTTLLICISASGNWLSSLITKSHKQGTLHLDDVYDLPDFLKSTPLTNKLEANWFDEIKRCPQNPNLIRATLRTMGWKLILFGLLLIPLESLNIIQPLLLIYFMKFFEPCSTMFFWQAWLAALAVIMDFVQLPHGENTLVGDQGVMLSGGQKARVNMARALYHDADIYLLDDPLSAVDSKVSKHLFDKSIKYYLRDKIRILVTHQIQFLQGATKIIVLDNGEMIQMGTYEELLVSSPSFAQLLEDINQHEQQQQQQPASLLNQQSMIGSINSEKDNVEEEDINSLPKNLETKQKGTVKLNVYVSYLRAGIGVSLGFLLIIIIFSTQQAITIYSNWWLAAWSNDESHHHNQNSTNCMVIQDKKNDRIYQMNDIEWNTYRNRRFYIFCVLVSILCFLIFLRTIVCQLICLNAGRVLHNKMFKRIIRCPISFFDTNPVGRILNRFTTDVATMDDSLPMNLLDFLVCLSQVLGTVTLVVFINPWSFIPAIIATSGMFFFRHRFASFSRDIQRLLGITRSPMYSQLTSTIHGLKVIRSYHAENICSKEFHYHLDNTTRVKYLIEILQRWSAMRFDWITLIFIGLVIVFAIIVRISQRQFSIVEIALTLTYSLNLMGLFQWTIIQSVEVETQMTSVERILEYCSLDQEPPSQLSSKYRPPTNWPSQGCIIFENVSMSHSKELHSPLALHHISLIIKSGEKIGIVGRTGAGKSSFIQTLFRMGTLVDGNIIIENIDIGTIGLDDVRRRISIIPQDPILFTGTMRSNLDPFGLYSDVEIWNALEQVQLKKLITDMMFNGLHSLVSESGSNLSVGQKQLVCLARAILKKSKILVIDEATANVDNVTDELIQRAIRDKFKECTVLTVAHRLRTVIDSDRIMVLSNGRLVEFDSPQVLLSNDYSHFSLLVEQTGIAEAEYLRTLANSSESYTRRKQDIYNLDDEPALETNEMDPLVPSLKSL
ncbi:unnamed protein product, partial [Rotaria sordida]